MALHVDVLVLMLGNGLFEAWVPGPHFGALPITSRVAVVPSLYRCSAPVQVHRPRGAARDAHLRPFEGIRKGFWTVLVGKLALADVPQFHGPRF